jgi:Tfp pilus assembly protein PilF
VKIDPKASTSFLRLSYLYEADGDKDKADAARQSALKLDPSLATVTPTPGQ